MSKEANALADQIYRLEPNLINEGLENFDGYFVHWDEIIKACQQAWPEPVGYAQSPLELIARLIDERGSAWIAGRDAAAAISQEWVDSRSCGLDGDPCAHRRLAATITDRITALQPPTSAPNVEGGS